MTGHPTSGPDLRLTAEQVRALPKVELHCHLEGSVPASTAIALARRNAVPLPTTNPDELYRFDTLEEFLAVYQAVSRAMARPEDFVQAVYESLVDAARSCALRYREFAFNPTNHPAVPLTEMVPAMAEGADAAYRETGVQARFIVAINREQPPDVALDLVRAAVRLNHPYVVGIGLDHNELVGPPRDFAAAFAVAAEAGLGRTAHAGERGDPVEVAQTIDVLGVNRIDHGYAVLRDPDLMARSRDAALHFAGSWSTARFHAAGEESPIPAMLRAGLEVSVNSDDPPMFGTDIAEEYLRTAELLRWSAEDAKEFVVRTAQASFLPAPQRAALVADLEADIDQLALTVAS